MNLTPLTHTPLFGKLGLLVSLLPLMVGIYCAIRPTERGLALMRPLSLAAIFASVSNLLLGLANGLHAAGMSDAGRTDLPPAAVMLGEALIPSFVGFAFLTVAWLCVAIAVRKTP